MSCHISTVGIEEVHFLKEGCDEAIKTTKGVDKPFYSVKRYYISELSHAC